jgi:hypothetical protein
MIEAVYQGAVDLRPLLESGQYHNPPILRGQRFEQKSVL